MTETQKTSYLFIVNDSPYGNERPYNALRLALNLIKREGTHVQVFLMGDGVNCSVAGQKTPEGYYNVERMLKSIGCVSNELKEGASRRFSRRFWQFFEPSGRLFN